jgi:Leucine-rich repeat (LRR) protein
MNASIAQSIYFYHFHDGLRFLKKARCGKIVPHLDSSVGGYLWKPDNQDLSAEQLEIISEQAGEKYFYHDADTNLTWYLKDTSSRSYFSEPFELGGHRDWRPPTLKELKTLSLIEPNKSGIYAKESLNGLIQGLYSSITKEGSDTVWWDFDHNRKAHEEYTDGKIIWGSEGQFSGFESSVAHNHAKRILVRGGNLPKDGWAIKLIDWLRSDGAISSEFEPTIDYLVEEVKYLPLKSTPPPEIDYLRGLERLDIPEAVVMPELSWIFPNLQSLRICLTDGHFLPKGIFNLVGLKSLCLVIGNTFKIPEPIGNLLNLDQLLLYAKGELVVPDSIGNLAYLRTLKLSGRAAYIPDAIGSLSRLECLSISGSFSKIPDSIGRLKNIRRIECSAPLETFPASAAELMNMKELVLYKAPLSRNIQNVFRISSLERLKLGGCPIEKLPSDFSSLRNLRELVLSDTNIEELPESMIAMENLHTLKLKGSKIKSLPEWLTNMKSLRNIAAPQLFASAPKSLKDSHIWIDRI